MKQNFITYCQNALIDITLDAAIDALTSLLNYANAVKAQRNNQKLIEA